MYIFFALVFAVIALFLFSLNNDNYSGAGRLKLVGLLFFFVPRDAEAHLPPSPAREYLMKSMQEHGIR